MTTVGLWGVGRVLSKAVAVAVPVAVPAVVCLVNLRRLYVYLYYVLSSGELAHYLYH